MALLEVNDLCIDFHTREGIVPAVSKLHFSVDRGEILGIVGESGSGKSVTCYSLLGLVPMPPGRICQGTAMFDGQDLLTLKGPALRAVRGARISMIFQDPMTSLNPFMSIGAQIAESILLHHRVSKAEARQRALKALEEVGIRDGAKRFDAYPHAFSGGMRQRVMIAMALVTEPELLIADEPTTALDVTVQAQILQLLKDIQAKRQLAILFITHDLAVIRSLAHRVVVMEKGVIVEQGPAAQLFAAAQHPYTRKLIAAIPTRSKAPAATEQAPVLVQVEQLRTRFAEYRGLWRKTLHHETVAVNNISLNIHQGEILGLVGESGSGKSTFGRSLMRLVEPEAGRVLFEGRDLLRLDARALFAARRDFQMIFQDPYASLNPRMTVFDTLAEPLRVHQLATKAELPARVNALMDDVGLARKAVRKYPHEFSGGQRQRIAIARALALNPKFIIADEPVSALDVTIQAQILELLQALTQRHQLTMLFISHDLAVVRYLCDRVAVMQHGNLVEIGPSGPLFAQPQHPYTQKLLSAIPHWA